MESRVDWKNWMKRMDRALVATANTTAFIAPTTSTTAPFTVAATASVTTIATTAVTPCLYQCEYFYEASAVLSEISFFVLRHLL